MQLGSINQDPQNCFLGSLTQVCINKVVAFLEKKDVFILLTVSQKWYFTAMTSKIFKKEEGVRLKRLDDAEKAWDKIVSTELERIKQELGRVPLEVAQGYMDRQHEHYDLPNKKLAFIEDYMKGKRMDCYRLKKS